MHPYFERTFYYPIYGMVVEVFVTEVETVYVADDELKKQIDDLPESIWYSETNPKYKSEFDIDGFYVSRLNEHKEYILSHVRQGNEFVWIDEPVGNALKIGYDVFETLDEALLYCGWMLKRERKHPLNKLNRIRRNRINWVAATQGKRLSEELLREWGYYNLQSKKICVKT